MYELSSIIITLAYWERRTAWRAEVTASVKSREAAGGGGAAEVEEEGRTSPSAA